MSTHTHSSEQPVVFACAHAKAERVDTNVLIELHSATSNMRMIWSVPAREAMGLAHQIEKAFHHWSEDQPDEMRHHD